MSQQPVHNERMVQDVPQCEANKSCNPGPLHLAVVYGSVRASRAGINAARFIAKKLGERKHKVTLIDPIEYDLPFLTRMYKEYKGGDDKPPKLVQDLHDIFTSADVPLFTAFVVVTGEYNHTMPPALTNLMDHFQSEYLWKPSGIVCYSAGPFGGVRAAVSLREFLGELGCPAIPSAFPISSVYKAFDTDGNDLTDDKMYDRRVSRFLNELEWYATSLRHGRAHVKLPY